MTIIYNPNEILTDAMLPLFTLYTIKEMKEGVIQVILRGLTLVIQFKSIYKQRHPLIRFFILIRESRSNISSKYSFCFHAFMYEILPA